MSVAIDGKNIPVKYAHNIWTDKRSAGFIVGVALVALLTVAGVYAVWPLKGIGLSSVGWWMLGSAEVLAMVEVIVVVAWVKRSEPQFQVGNQFSSLARFENEDKAFDFAKFETNGHSYVAVFVKEGRSRHFRIFRDNEIFGEFWSNIKKTHKWAPAQN
ncbi:hypothetical protein ACFLR2_01145 [Chlamydiota bacterium]